MILEPFGVFGPPHIRNECAAGVLLAQRVLLEHVRLEAVVPFQSALLREVLGEGLKGSEGFFHNGRKSITANTQLQRTLGH